jgi:DNA-binding CsgD family transcriptional regulator
LFRRLAVFLGGFDLDAAQAVCGGGDVARYQVLDQLSLLVDKSLVVAENTSGRTRYRLLETVRQYALEKLGESGEADAVRAGHRDHYTALAARLDTPAQSGHERYVEQAEIDIDNLRAAFAWSRENSDIALALALASSLQPLWLTRGRIKEGLTWFDTALGDEDAGHAMIASAARAQARADKAVLNAWVGATNSMDQAEQALTIARDVNDPALLTRALTACGCIAGYNAEVARPFFAEAIGLARAIGDKWRLSQILGWQAYAAICVGDPIAARAAAEEGRDFADAIGDRFVSRQCRWALGYAKTWSGDLVGAVAQFGGVVAEAEAGHDVISGAISLGGLGIALAYQGDTSAARATADAALELAADLGGIFDGIAYTALATAALAAGDPAVARDASEAASRHMSVQPETAAIVLERTALAALACGDLAAARRWADEAVSATAAWPYHALEALATRARIAVAQGEPEQAEYDVHDALVHGARIRAYLDIPDVLECLADLAADTGSHNAAARLFGAADAARQRMGAARFKIHDAGCQALVRALREALGDNAFEAAWAEGAGLSIDEAIAYAQRGRGERKRPSSGWASLTPAEVDVVRLVTEGLGNKDIATRLFVSPRTVQSHLTHVYTKLGLTSRVQLAQEAARHADA